MSKWDSCRHSLITRLVCLAGLAVLGLPHSAAYADGPQRVRRVWKLSPLHIPQLPKIYRVEYQDGQIIVTTSTLGADAAGSDEEPQQPQQESGDGDESDGQEGQESQAGSEANQGGDETAELPSQNGNESEDALELPPFDPDATDEAEVPSSSSPPSESKPSRNQPPRSSRPPATKPPSGPSQPKPPSGGGGILPPGRGGNGNPNLKPGEVLNIEFPDLGPDRRGNVTKMQVRIPDNYTTDKLFPMAVWLGGGSGGAHSNGVASLVDRRDFVLVGLPYPKGANDRYQATMVGNFPYIWRYHEQMLAALQKLVPNINPRFRMVAGFSNGAHCIDGLLRLPSGAPAEYYNVYVLVDGGGVRLTGRYPQHVLGQHLMVLWGDRSPNARWTPNVAASGRAAGMITNSVQMTATGHAFPKTYRAVVAEWIEQVVIPVRLR